MNSGKEVISMSPASRKVFLWIMVVLWAVVTVLSFDNKMMLAMELMGIGMLAEALVSLVGSYRQHRQ